MPRAKPSDRIAGIGLRWLLIFLAWCTTVIVPGLTFGDNLDGSWQASYDYFALHHFKAGVDYLFTYGPLGLLQTYVYNQDLFWFELVFQFLYRFFLLSEIVRTFAVCRVSVKEQNLFFLFIIVFLNLFSSIINYSVFELYNDLFLIVLVFACLVDENRPLWRGAVAAIFCSILVLGKANLFPLVLLAITIDTVRHRLQKRPLWSSPLVLFLVGYAVFWFASGQSLQNFLPYLSGTLQIILGYNEAMAFDSQSGMSPLWLGTACVEMVCVVALLFEILRTDQAIKTLMGRLTAVYFVLALLAVYKSTFTREDLHVVLFFLVMSLVLLWLALLATGKRSPYRALIITVVSVLQIVNFVFLMDLGSASIAQMRESTQRSLRNPIQVVTVPIDRLPPMEEDSAIRFYQPPLFNTLKILLAPFAYLKEIQARQEIHKAIFDLPLIRSIVGSSPVDIWAPKQNILFLNGLNYRGRPVFQSYSAYNAYTADLNARFYSGPMAPDYVLFRFSTIDEHFASQEDSAALQVLLHRYTPVLRGGEPVEEKGYVLLHREEVSPAEDTLVQRLDFAAVTFGSVLQLPKLIHAGDYRILHLREKKTVQGVLRSLLFHSLPVRLTLDYSDEKEEYGYIVPSTAALGFIITPVLNDNRSFLHMYQWDTGRPEVLELRLDAAAPGDYQATYEVTVEEVKPFTHRMQSSSP